MTDIWARSGWDSLRKRSLVVSGVALALCAVGAVIDPRQFFRSYLSAYIFWIGIPLGCWALLMLHHLVGGRWGFVIQRVLESAAQTFPLMAAFFVPILFGMQALYPWARPEAVAADPALQGKAAYLNVPFFIARAAVYFAIWIGASQLLSRWSLEQDRSGDAAWVARLQRLSGPGLVLYGLTVTFSAIDWLMSLEPHWYSTIYGMLYMVSYGLAALALAIIVVYLLENEKPLVQVMAPDRFHDLGNLLLALVMFWAYVNFSQFLLVWAGNLAEEIPWYLHRLRGGWQWVALALVIFQFALPFLLLLARAIKCRGRTLALIAAAILFMHWVDMMWLVAPSFYPAQFHIHWLDVVALIGIGGLWLAVFLTSLKARSLLPLRDPRFAELLERVQEA
jgi:hypothetical protein